MKNKFTLEDWFKEKLAPKYYYCLSEKLTVEFEFYKIYGPRAGFAFVKFECNPSDRLSFQTNDNFDSKMPTDWAERFEFTIFQAIVDGLLCVSLNPYFGCELNLVEIKFGEVNSDQDSFYKATKEAMKELIQTGKWGYIYK